MVILGERPCFGEVSSSFYSKEKRKREEMTNLSKERRQETEYREINISDISIGSRHRKDMGDLESLQFSISQYGLLQPIIVSPMPGGTYELYCGERRLQACKKLGKKTISARLYEELSDIEQQEIELEENIRREQLNWQEESYAIRQIFKLKKERNRVSTPAGISSNYSQSDVANELNVSQTKISQSVRLADALDKYPELHLSMTRQEAFARLRKLKMGKCVTKSSLMQKIKESFIESTPMAALKRLETNSVHMIIADVRDYLSKEFLEECLRVQISQRQGFLFYPFEKYQEVYDMLDDVGAVHSVVPFIWHKRDSNDYELFTWFSKEQEKPPKSISKHISCREDTHYIHEWAKPYQLYHALVMGNTLKKHFIVNPIAYDLNLVKLCMDNDRGVLAACPQKILREEWLLNIRG